MPKSQYHNFNSLVVKSVSEFVHILISTNQLSVIIQSQPQGFKIELKMFCNSYKTSHI